MTNHTSPERSAEYRICRRILAQVMKCGGCGMCLNRDRDRDAWDRGFCATPNQTFPLCLKTRGTQFELDESTVKKAA